MKIVMMTLLLAAISGCTSQSPQSNDPPPSAVTPHRNIPADVSTIRGFNYESAPTIGHNEMWLQYDPAETERDMDYARRLNLNQVRVFLGYTAYTRDKAAFLKNLVHFIRACRERGIGVMPTLQYPREWYQDQASWTLAR